MIAPIIAEDVLAKLKTNVIGKNVMTYNSLDSTNRLLMELAHKNSPEGTVIFAEEQSRGRGRLSRSWVSPKGKGLYFSILLRPNMKIDHMPKLTLLAAVAIIEALHPHKKGIGIRWPNDIVIGHRKLGGILTEMNTESDQLRSVVVGIGLNVHKGNKPLPNEGVSLEEATGHVWNRLDLACSILQKLEKHYELLKKGNDKLLTQGWEKHSILAGKRVTATTAQGTMRGTAMGIDATGALWIREDSGLQTRLTSADLQLIR